MRLGTIAEGSAIAEDQWLKYEDCFVQYNADRSARPDALALMGLVSRPPSGAGRGAQAALDSQTITYFLELGDMSADGKTLVSFRVIMSNVEWKSPYPQRFALREVDNSGRLSGATRVLPLFEAIEQFVLDFDCEDICVNGAVFDVANVRVGRGRGDFPDSVTLTAVLTANRRTVFSKVACSVADFLARNDPALHANPVAADDAFILHFS